MQPWDDDGITSDLFRLSSQETPVEKQKWDRREESK